MLRKGPTTDHQQQTTGTDRVDLYYSDQWQVIHERFEVEDGGATFGEEGGGSLQGGGYVVETDYVWSLAYVDGLVLRDRDVDMNPSNGKEERLYVQQDANFNVTALVDTSGDVVERFVYDPYGGRRAIKADRTNYAFPPQGIVGLYGFRHGHQGGRLDPTSGLMLFRHRSYSPSLGRWVQQDPLGYVDGSNTYQYVLSAPVTLGDPYGFQSTHPRSADDVMDSLGFAPKQNEHEKAREEGCDDTAATAAGVRAGLDEATKRAAEELTDPVNAAPAGVGLLKRIVKGALRMVRSSKAAAGAAGGAQGAGGAAAGAAGAAAVGNTAQDVRGIVASLPDGLSRGVKEVPDNDAMRGLFEKLIRGGKKVDSPPDRPDIDVRALPDGTRIQYRPDTKSGGDGIDITYPDGTRHKIHIPKQK